MGQRLGVAAALLGDPQVLLLDEPVNGLDPEGVLWIRNLMKGLASQGKTVLVSSHLMNEMAVTADHLIVIGRGRLIVAAATEDVIARGSGQAVRVRTPEPDRLTDLIVAEGGKAIPAANGNRGAGEPGGQAPILTVTGVAAPRIGELAASASIVLHELTPQLMTLEEAFLELTADSLEFGHLNPEPASQSAEGTMP
jgi:ABC-2 type transport system ATP-binding protein